MELMESFKRDRVFSTGDSLIMFKESFAKPDIFEQLRQNIVKLLKVEFFKSLLQNYLGCFLGLFSPRFGLVLANHAWLAANSALYEAKKSLRKPLQLILQEAL